MRIDLPQCGFHYCRFQFDGNCTSTGKYEKCEYRYLSEQIEPERKKGKWIRNRDEDGWRMWLECAECGAIEQNLNSNYCHNCGSYNGGVKRNDDG